MGSEDWEDFCQLPVSFLFVLDLISPEVENHVLIAFADQLVAIRNDDDDKEDDVPEAKDTKAVNP